jgi:hypothetical protein
LLKIDNPDKIKKCFWELRKNIDYFNLENFNFNLDLSDINNILYRCEKEELDNTDNKRGNYEIPG